MSGAAADGVGDRGTAGGSYWAGRGRKARGQTPGLSRICWYLHHHLSHEDRREDVVGDAEEDTFLRRQGGGRGQLHPRDPTPPRRKRGPHGASWVDVWPLQGNGDTVQEDENQDNVIKHLMSDDLLAGGAEPGRPGVLGEGSGIALPKPWLHLRPQTAGGTPRGPRGSLTAGALEDREGQCSSPQALLTCSVGRKGTAPRTHGSDTTEACKAPAPCAGASNSSGERGRRSGPPRLSQPCPSTLQVPVVPARVTG